MSFLRFFRREGFPPLPGSFEVGTFDLLFGKGRDSLLARLYYPATLDTNEETLKKAEWLPDSRYAAGYMNYLKKNQTILGRLFSFLSGSEEMPAYWEAPLLSKKSSDSQEVNRLPIIVFSHGLSGMRTCYSSICCSLASEGYLVAALEHRDLSACTTFYKADDSSCNELQWLQYQHLKPGEKEWPLRNHQLSKRVSETSELLDLLQKIDAGTEVTNELPSSFNLAEMKGRLNFEKVAIIGHSFGGATAIQSLNDKRFKCAVVYDAWMFPIHQEDPMDMTQPILFLNAEVFHWPQNIESMNQLIEKDSVNRKMYTIRGTEHLFCTDFGLVFRYFLSRFFKFIGELNHSKSIELTRRYSSAFLLAKLNSGMSDFEAPDDPDIYAGSYLTKPKPKI